MRCKLSVVSAAAALTLLMAGQPGPAAAQGASFFVNTTEDILPIKPTFCVPGETCTFRAALDRAQVSGGRVRACFPDTPSCPSGIRPLGVDDPHYDPATGRWTLQFNEKTFIPYLLEADDVLIDFTMDIPGWSGPADNRMVLDGGSTHLPNNMMVIMGAGNRLAGLEIRGQFIVAAIVLRDGAVENQLGPGLVLAGISQGISVLFRGADVTRNRMVGSWCGITGDGTVVDPVQDDCVVLEEGANLNVIGGPEPADRNIIAASAVGNGISFNGDATRNNTIQGNYIGTDPSGTKAVGLESGVAIFRQASDNKVLGNVLSGNRGAGVFSADASTQFGRTLTLIEGNFIGTDPSGEKPVPNKGFGVRIEGQSRDVRVYRNLIRFNRTVGVLVCGTSTQTNTISENRVTDNKTGGIQLCPGANAGVKPPVILAASLDRVAGTACPRCRVEVFSDPGEQADTFEGAVEADEEGAWVLDKPEGFTYRSLTATATDEKSTSGLSVAAVVAPGATPTATATATTGPGDTPTPGPVTPTATPGDPGPDERRLFLPWLGNRAEG